MTPEFLLEAMGLLDDDLILQAEGAPAHKPVPWQRWLGLCACLALVFFVGRGVVQNWSGSNTSGSAGASASNGAGSPSSGNAWGSAGTSGSASSALPDDSTYILVENRSYAPTGEIVPELPAGAEELGVLSQAREGAPSPCTNGAEYVGCMLYTGPEDLLYVQLPQGGYGVFGRMEPGP